MPEGLQASEARTGLGFSRVDCAHGNVIDISGGGLSRLLYQGIGGADKLPWVEHAASIGHGHVILSQVEAVGTTLHCKIGVVVDDEDSVMVLAQRRQSTSDKKLLSLIVALITKLNR